MAWITECARISKAALQDGAAAVQSRVCVREHVQCAETAPQTCMRLALRCCTRPALIVTLCRYVEDPQGVTQALQGLLPVLDAFVAVFGSSPHASEQVCCQSTPCVPWLDCCPQLALAGTLAP